MVVLLVGVVGSVAGIMALELYLIMHAIKEAGGASKIFKNLPRVDPPPNTPEFYDIQVSLYTIRVSKPTHSCVYAGSLILACMLAHSFLRVCWLAHSCVYAENTCALQIPVQKDNIGKDFHPAKPSTLAAISNQEKLEVVRLLTAENELKLDHFLHAIRNPPFWASRGLVLVGSSLEVDGLRKCAVKYSRKTEESILAKACRPNILADNPAFGIEHVRDTFRYVTRLFCVVTTCSLYSSLRVLFVPLRFKAVVHSFRDALSFMLCMNRSKSLAAHGMSPETVAKLDIAKLLKPKEWVSIIIL
jgi:hypothetical protein